MKISDFLQTQSVKHSPQAMTGGMVFVNLDRPLDQAIRHALGLSTYHPGQPSPWSHCFLLAQPYAGGSTQILDCTIRDSNNGIIWNSSLQDDIKVLTLGMEGREGGIYTGRVDDYDNAKVLNCGFYYLPSISLTQRNQIVNAALELQSAGYKYDLPGLLRELFRLLFGIAMKPSSHMLLFCSAFLATTYRNSLGTAWNVVPNVASVDVSPDEIWFSPPGSKEKAV